MRSRGLATLFLAGAALPWGPGCRKAAPATPTVVDGKAPAATPASPADGLPETQARPGTHIALLYAANLQGEYEHCGCPSHPEGGLVRRATVIDRARAESGGVLVVDAGDMLLPQVFHGDKLARAPAGEWERRARLILASYRRMGTTAVLPAERDLGLGPEKLKKLLKSFGVPAVASNLLDQRGRPLFERDRIVTVAGIPVGIFGVVQPLPEDAAVWKAWRLHTTDPVAAARDEVASLKARGAKMIVALIHLGPVGAANQFLDEVPGIDWAVQGHTGMQLQPPSVTKNGAHLLDAMSLGKLAGRLDIHVVGGSFHFQDRGERAQLLAIMADHRQQLADLAKRAAEDKSGQLQDFYRQRRAAIDAALARETQQAGTLPRAIEGSWYEGQIISLDDAIPDQQGVAQLVAAYNVENARRAAAGLGVGIALGTLAAAHPATARASDAGQEKATRYAGSAACISCHPSEARFFATTKHAQALGALAAPGSERRDRDPTCIGCHTTGFMLPGGTWSVAVAVDRLKDVGCESCHGPSLGHISLADKKTTTRRQVPETACRGCHTPDQTSGEFDYQKFRAAIVGPGHGA